MHQFLAKTVHLHHDRIDAASKVQIGRHRRYRNQQSNSSGKQCHSNAVGKGLSLPHGASGCDVVK